jgi:hypothetical protein
MNSTCLTEVASRSVVRALVEIRDQTLEATADHDSGHVRIIVFFECLSDWSPSSVRPTGAKNEKRGWMSRVTAEGNVLVTKM